MKALIICSFQIARIALLVVEIGTILIAMLALSRGCLTCAFQNIENIQLSIAYNHEQKENETSKRLNENRHISFGRARNLLEYLFYFNLLEARIRGMKRQTENASYTNVMCFEALTYS